MDFAAPHRRKQKSTPMPQIHNIIGSENSMKKGGTPISTRVPRESIVHASIAPDATCEYSDMGKHWKNDEQDTRRFCHEKHGVKRKSRWLVLKDLQKPNECKDDSDGCIDTWVEMMSHL